MKNKKKKFGLATKAPIFVGLLVIFTALAIGITTYIPINSNLVKSELNGLVHDSRLIASEFNSKIRELKNDVNFLSKVPPVHEIIKMRTGPEYNSQNVNPVDLNWRNRLETMFMALLDGKKDYLQIRFIGIENKGKEIVRVDRKDQMIRVVPEGELQSKGDRDYFSETIKLNSDEIYLSNLNLNREFGKISLPYSPVVRAGIPVYDSSNNVFGIIIINANISSWFESMSRQISASKKLYITNEKGDFYWHPKEDKRFGFEFDEPYTVQNEFGKNFNLLSSVDSVIIQNKIEIDDSIHGIGYYKYQFDQRNSNRLIGIIVAFPYDLVVGENQKIRNLTIIIGVLLTIIVICIAYYFVNKLIIKIGGEPEEIEGIANNIINGELKLDVVDSNSVKTGIWASICAMVETLNKNEIYTNNQDWLKTNLSVVLAYLQEVKGIDDLSNQLLYKLVMILGGCSGCFYAIDMEEVNTDDGSMALMAVFGLEYTNIQRHFINVEDGLVGQVIKSGEMIHFKNIENYHFTVVSGTGKFKPVHLLICPVKFEGQVVAVIEVGSIVAFTEIQLEFMKQISISLAISISNLKNQMHTDRLLVESQKLTEDLKNQSEELKVLNEELAENTNQLTQQTEELRVTNEELEHKSQDLKLQKLEVESKNDELKNAQLELEKQANEILSASKYKTEFLANMSHELRTPLNSLLILSKSLSQNKKGNLERDQIESLEIIYNGGQELLLLINDILDLSKIESGKMDINLDKVNIQAFLEMLIKKYEHSAFDKNLKLNLNISNNFPGIIISDAQRLNQILGNLLSNAIKFTETGAVSIQVKQNQTNHNIVFEIIDTGIGIPLDKLDLIFDAFKQVDGSTSRNYGGTGLGLTISRELATLLGGQLTVESEVGIGSKFILEIQGRPVERIDSDNQNEENIQSLEYGKRPLLIANNKTLLIIEKDMAFTSILKKVVTEKGYSCMIAERGGDGIIIAEKIKPNGIILGVPLSDMLVNEVIDLLKNNEETAKIPIHVISEESTKNNYKLKGVFEYIKKPITDIKELEKIIESFEMQGESFVKNVLIVEDNLNTCHSIKELLKHLNIQFTISNDGKSAIEEILTNHFDCIILDIILPDISAFSLLDNLAKEENVTLPPIVIYTSKDLSREEFDHLLSYTDSIVLKHENSAERLVDEVSLFLYNIEKITADKMDVDSKKLRLDGKRILLVDDDSKNLFAITRVLEEYNIIVEKAENGQIAIEKLRTLGHVDVVLMDIMMPVMDGVTAMKIIRQDENLKNVPIIALTAKAMPQDRDYCLNAGANDYLTKPLNIDKLIEVISVWVKNKG